MYGENIFVYSKKTKRWKKRTTKGVAWVPHLYTMFDDRGEKTDEFEKFLGQDIETPADLPLKKAAKQPDSLSKGERQIIAMFIGVTVARTPSMMQGVMQDYVSGKRKILVNRQGYGVK